MVFGWSKKKEEKKSEEIPSQKQIRLSDVSEIIRQILELRTLQILSDIKSIRDSTEPLIKELIMIGNTLEKDNLQVDEIDKHLRIIVVRGKQQVIDMIKKDAMHLPNIASYDDAENTSAILNQMLKKIGDVLGRQTRVIHIFAKKYAEKLKEILLQMNSNHVKIQQLLKNHDDSKLTSAEILESIKEIHGVENNLVKKEQRINEIRSYVDSLDKKIISIEDLIKKIETSDEYEKFLDLKQILDEFTIKKNQIKHEIDSQFTKISRPLSRYEYASSMDKEQKHLLSQLIKDPFDVLLSKNRDSIILILENVRKGISSGSISVKDQEKSFSQITETEEALDGFIKQVNDFVDKKQNIENQMGILEPDELSDLTRDLKNALSNKKDSELKIKTFQVEINEDHSSIKKLISDVEVKLRTFSNTVYAITY
ncbi:putative leucine-rich repeat-containing protein DDB_G0290503 [Nitrosarchaeum sp.]|nr:putative leucine-rich repeat-containing protein DDB_G0290503 [Nitrosarchaeum sp.]